MTDDAEPLEMPPLPPFRATTHFQAAFGGLFGTVNLLVGAVSIFHQIIRAFEIGLSPVLRDVFAAYVQIFHGLINSLAQALTWITGFNFMPPPWAHDWIVLWFVFAGAAFRLYSAGSRVDLMLETGSSIASVTMPPGLAYRFLQFVDTKVFLVVARTKSQRLATALTLAAIYLIMLVLWPWFLVEVSIMSPVHEPAEEPPDDLTLTRISFRALFLLQTLAIALAIFGLSVINVQTR